MLQGVRSLIGLFGGGVISPPDRGFKHCNMMLKGFLFVYLFDYIFAVFFSLILWILDPVLSTVSSAPQTYYEMLIICGVCLQGFLLLHDTPQTCLILM